MSKENNLTDFLTDVADAIREKKGTTEKINPQNFSSEIRSIEGGGGGIPTAEWNDVNFYDYEGTILYSYTWDEFVAKNEMPPLPTHHERLTCQEWNYTLEEVLEQGGRCDVGAIYIPTDGNTHIFLKNTKTKGSIYIKGTQSKDNCVEVNWGDGTIERFPGTTVVYSHEYDNIDNIEIILAVDDGCTLLNLQLDYSYCVKEMWIGDKTMIAGSSILNSSCEKIVYPKTTTFKIATTFMGDFYTTHINLPKYNGYSIHTFQSSGVRTVSIPNNVTSLSENWFNGVKTLQYLHIGSNITTIKGSFITSTTNLYDISVSKNNPYFYIDKNSLMDNRIMTLVKSTTIGEIPDNTLIIGTFAFAGNKTIRSINIPSSVHTIGNGAFNSCSALGPIVYIPKNVTTIVTNAFIECIKITTYDFRNHESVPTIGNTNSVYCVNSNVIIILPDDDELNNEWINSTNWSAIKGKFMKASEYEALNS